MTNQQLANDLQKPTIRKIQKCRLYPPFIDKLGSRYCIQGII